MISSLSNAKVKYVRRLQSDRHFRSQEKQFAVEGTRWLQELVIMERLPALLFYTERWLATAVHAQILQQISDLGQLTPLLVSEQVMQSMSDTRTPAGILAVVAMQPKSLPASPSLLLVLDGLNTPGNLGTILRTAAAAGADGVLLGPGTVDCYNPKVVRGSMGALLRLPVANLTWSEVARTLRGMQVWLAIAAGGTRYTAVDWRQPSALIIGGEATGASIAAAKLADGRLTIPMQAATESLNAAVAAGIILFEAVRQRDTLS